MPTLCILLSLAFGLGSVATYCFVDGGDVDHRIDALMITASLAGLSLAAFVLAICFALAGLA
jgi:hypothetical protein